ncbi:hypothetical protein [Bosea sp. AS-1]|uniref:hypothetical protein n=1 Tax=Bosea sp. AS-1 TaxID=2015316 RepID=UPI000B77F3D8|nr:hypothetical protein [Bosea sp. AS-1]
MADLSAFNLQPPEQYDDLHYMNARRHALQRAAERCGWALTDAQVDAHEDAVWNFETTILGYGGANRELHLIDGEGGDFLAVWCPHLECIVTYLEHTSQWRGSLLRRDK